MAIAKEITPFFGFEVGGYWFEYQCVPMGITNSSAIYGGTIGRFTRVCRSITTRTGIMEVSNYCDQQGMCHNHNLVFHVAHVPLIVMCYTPCCRGRLEPYA